MSFVLLMRFSILQDLVAKLYLTLCHDIPRITQVPITGTQTDGLCTNQLHVSLPF